MSNRRALLVGVNQFQFLPNATLKGCVNDTIDFAALLKDTLHFADDDITLFEYVKRNNRETGPALVGIELGDPADLPGLLRRMELAPPSVERVPANSPMFRFLL